MTPHLIASIFIVLSALILLVLFLAEILNEVELHILSARSAWVLGFIGTASIFATAYHLIAT